MGNHLVVRQYDAHAWAEIWLANEGWVRVDPTAAVAPGRIERGLAGGLPAEELASLSLFSTARLGDVAGLRDLLHLLDSIEHRWTMWVVGYDTALQARYLTELLGKVTPLRIGIALVVGGCLSMLLVAATLVWRRGVKHQHPAVRAFCVFARRLERFGVKREPSESPAAFVTRVATDRGIAPHVYQPVVENLNRLLYNPGAGDAADDLKHLKRKIRTLQLQLALSIA
jgi:hypothetical protein